MAKLFPRLISPALPEFNLGGLSIRKTNSYDVNDHFRIVKHNHYSEIDDLYVMFDRFEDVKSFEISYTISAANMVDLIKGKLNVVINKIPNLPDDEF
jgi:hypothetical protein